MNRRIICLDIPQGWLASKQEHYYEKSAKGNRKSTSTASIRDDLIDECPGKVTQNRLNVTREMANENPDLEPGSYFDEPKFEFLLRRIIDRAFSVYGLFDLDEMHRNEIVMRSIYEDGVWLNHGSMTYSDAETVLENTASDTPENCVNRGVNLFAIAKQHSKNNIPPRFDREYFRKHYIEKENPDTMRDLAERINNEVEGESIKFHAVRDRFEILGIDTSDKPATLSLINPDEFKYRHLYELRPASDSLDRQVERDDLEDANFSYYHKEGTDRRFAPIGAMDEQSKKSIIGAEKSEIKQVYYSEHGSDTNRIEVVADEYDVPVPLAETALVFHEILDRYRYLELSDLAITTDGSDSGCAAITDPEDGERGSGVLACLYIHLDYSIEEVSNYLNVSQGVVRFAIRYYRHENRRKPMWVNPTKAVGRPSDAVIDAPDGSGSLTDPQYLRQAITEEGSVRRVSNKHKYESDNDVRKLANMYQLETPIAVDGFNDGLIEVDSHPERAVACLLMNIDNHSYLTNINIEYEYIGRSRKRKGIVLDISELECEADEHKYTPDFEIKLNHKRVYLEVKGDKDNAEIKTDAKITDKQKAEAVMETLGDNEKYVTITDGVDLVHYDDDFRFDTDPTDLFIDSSDILREGDDSFAAMIEEFAPDTHKITDFN